MACSGRSNSREMGFFAGTNRTGHRLTPSVRLHAVDLMQNRLPLPPRRSGGSTGTPFGGLTCCPPSISITILCRRYRATGSRMPDPRFIIISSTFVWDEPFVTFRAFIRRCMYSSSGLRVVSYDATFSRAFEHDIPDIRPHPGANS